MKQSAPARSKPAGSITETTTRLLAAISLLLLDDGVEVHRPQDRLCEGETAQQFAHTLIDQETLSCAPVASSS